MGAVPPGPTGPRRPSGRDARYQAGRRRIPPSHGPAGTGPASSAPTAPGRGSHAGWPEAKPAAEGRPGAGVPGWESDRPRRRAVEGPALEPEAHLVGTARRRGTETSRVHLLEAAVQAGEAGAAGVPAPPRWRDAQEPERGTGGAGHAPLSGPGTGPDMALGATDPSAVAPRVRRSAHGAVREGRAAAGPGGRHRGRRCSGPSIAASVSTQAADTFRRAVSLAAAHRRPSLGCGCRDPPDHIDPDLGAPRDAIVSARAERMAGVRARPPHTWRTVPFRGVRHVRHLRNRVSDG